MTIAVDTSTPVWTIVNSASTSITSAAFSPPAGSLVVIVLASSRAFTVSSLTDSASGLTNFTARSQSTGSTDTGSQIWVADCASAQTGITVTAHLGAAVRCAIGIVVLTGTAIATAQTGAHLQNFAFTGAPTGAITTTANGSLVLAAFGSRSGGTSPTVPGGQTLVFNAHTFDGAIAGTGNDHQWAQWTGSITATSGTSVTINDTNSTDWCIALAEILASTASPIDLTGNGLAHTRAQGAPKINPTVGPAGQTHGRGQGAVTVATPGLLLPVGLVRAATLYPDSLLYPAAGLYPGAGSGRTLGIPAVTTGTPGAARQLGSIIVTVAKVLRPAGQARARAVGTIIVTGRAISLTGQARVRRQGNPTLGARVMPASLAHARGQGAPAVNRVTITVAGLTRGGGSQLLPSSSLYPSGSVYPGAGGGGGRTQGDPTITRIVILRPAGLAHARGQGVAVVHGRTIVSTPALAHARAQGNPTLSARVMPTGLAHARAQGAPEINLVSLHPLALARA